VEEFQPLMWMWYPVLTQSPAQVTVRVGQTVHLLCAMKNGEMEKIHLHWYQRRPGQGNRQIITHYQNHVQRYYVTERFGSKKNLTDNSCTLTITDVHVTDSSIYTCAVYSTIFGTGTVVTVIGK
uniref:Ig-like domain-containing protein n=1 Tax=Callorhinchus milii TaxID=7868 RepID=A0A4W3GN06_CALMI